MKAKNKFTLRPNELQITVTIPKIAMWRLKLFTIVLHFAAWLGGFGACVVETKTEPK